MSIFSLITIFIEFHSLGLLLLGYMYYSYRGKSVKHWWMQHFICYLFIPHVGWRFFFHISLLFVFLYKFREVFLFYILQPCSGQTFSFSFELASAVFNSLIYFDNDLIIFKNFKFILLNFINITSRSYLVDQKLLFFFLYRFLFR